MLNHGSAIRDAEGTQTTLLILIEITSKKKKKEKRNGKKLQVFVLITLNGRNWDLVWERISTEIK